MIKNDLHVHSIQSLCGMHTIFEIVEIAAKKDMRLINICDHGSASGKDMNFGVISDERRWPKIIKSSCGKEIFVLAGIEANILDLDGKSDLPQSLIGKFDLISAGFHHKFGKSAYDNTKALENYLQVFPLDILTHPCIKKYPLDIECVVEMSLEYGFALEVNNTKLRLDQTDLTQLEKMIFLTIERGGLLVESSDGHTFFEIGENEKVEEFLRKINVSGSDIFINRDDLQLKKFIKKRKVIR